MQNKWTKRAGVAALCAVWSVAVLAGATLDRVKKTHVLVEVLDQSYPPFSFLNAHNQMDGFDVDVAKAVAARLGARLKIETPSWEAITAGRWGNRFDICVCSMTPDKKKADILSFVSYYYSSPAVLVVNAANTRIKDMRDAGGKRIGVEQGSSYERYAQKALTLWGTSAQPTYPFDRVIVSPYASEDLAYQDLALGDGKRIDGIVSNYVTAKARLDKQPGKFRIVGKPLYLEPNWVAVDKGDPEWQALVAKVMSDLRKDGTISKISKKWIGSDITK
ncbi:transporter substrate-binding domain-containing protein [Paludibacterium yongneupense]|uniref:transporter substrate-binding domain-containing protein n=1 Tax=Paludibacterium yongneupense TaxID=400061 RepID=UPI0003F6F9A6|nr:transporter substrate-binding domain-containing protein [Paludibacterium yongneupense]